MNEDNDQAAGRGVGVRESEQIEPRANYTAADVARILRHSTRWFRANRRALHEREGFPRPISTVGQPRWHGEDLLNWLRRPKEDLRVGGNVVELRPDPERPRSAAESARLRDEKLGPRLRPWK